MLLSNYRSIALLPSLSKIFEYVLLENRHWLFKNCHSLKEKISKLYQHAYSLKRIKICSFPQISRYVHIYFCTVPTLSTSKDILINLLLVL